MAVAEGDQILKAGTIAVDVAECGNWTHDLGNLAVGDSVTRDLRLVNSSTLDIASVIISADIEHAPGPLGGDLTDAVTVDIIQDDDRVIANDVRLSRFAAAGYPLRLTDDTLPAGQDVDLRFVYNVVGAPDEESEHRDKGKREVVQNPDNKYQGAAVRVKSWTRSSAAAETRGGGGEASKCTMWDDDPQLPEVRAGMEHTIAAVRALADTMPEGYDVNWAGYENPREMARPRTGPADLFGGRRPIQGAVPLDGSVAAIER